MPKDNLPNLPDQKSLEKEIGDYLSSKYGGQIKIVSAGMFPAPAKDGEKKDRLKQQESLAFYFDMKPKELVAYLDEYIIRQDEAKAILATKICTHFNRIRHDLEKKYTSSAGRIKSNVLLIGPTGVGKTYMIKLIARHLGVPFVKGDATKFSETGYVGGDVEDLVRDLVREADGDTERAQYGIIYVDEIDKIAASPQRLGADVSRTGVQRAFLKPMEETEVEMKVPHDPISQIEAMEHYRATGKREKKVVNTKNILFIMSGAFTGLEDSIKKRVQQRSIGFEQAISSRKTSSRLFKQVKAEDLIEYGFESEFVGRLPVVAVLDELNAEDFYEILINPNSSVVVAKKQDFASYGINLQFTDEALRLIAGLAVAERTGARGLVSVMEHILLHFEKTLPSTKIKHLVVTEDLVNHPAEILRHLLDDEEFCRLHADLCQEQYEKEFERLSLFIEENKDSLLTTHGVVAGRKRIELIARNCQQEVMEPRQACEACIALIHRIQECAQVASDEHDAEISFAEDAIDHIITLEKWSLVPIVIRCERIFKAFEYGLKLMLSKVDKLKVRITVEGVDDPDRFIDKMVTDVFGV